MEEQSGQKIYVIGYDTAGPVKIGISNDPTKRLAQLQTGHERVLQIFCVEECEAENTLLLEQVIHRQLNHRRKRGEWFDLCVDDAVNEIRFAIIRWDSDSELRKKRRSRKR